MRVIGFVCWLVLSDFTFFFFLPKFNWFGRGLQICLFKVGWIKSFFFAICGRGRNWCLWQITRGDQGGSMQRNFFRLGLMLVRWVLNFILLLIVTFIIWDNLMWSKCDFRMRYSHHHLRQQCSWSLTTSLRIKRWESCCELH